MAPKISIIVPVYKVEQYIHKCINSILAQTFKEFELILVNDGSPDCCGEICDEYAKRDARIKVIHKENGGLADARNAGLEIAQGDYIGFVDSDDWIEPDMYELLYNMCTENDCEISSCTSTIYFTDKTVINGTHPLTIHDRNEAMKEILKGELYDEVVWTKLIKRNLLNDIRFPVGRIYEDTAFTYKVIHKSQRVCSIGLPKYHYIKRENSIMDLAIKNLRIDAVLIYNEMHQLIKVNYPQLSQLVILKLANHAMIILNLISLNGDFHKYKNEYYSVIEILNINFNKTIRLLEYPKTVKILLIAAKIHPLLYNRVINLVLGRRKV
ncbi:glycosyltransferase [Lederbergia citrea]|uniref:Glycosyltransferase n=1 Tax=Lederbergia citrea TaxID=2833581 RepID=A0A942USB5_9BACI|nr:glycosyltransferase [Lederbergia citrea]MBS4205804.1 glycosyltransferase [Lederbergia citrea]MBS4224747.1 glycosyltransferase [Lederbergia citrea]